MAKVSCYSISSTQRLKACFYKDWCYVGKVFKEHRSRRRSLGYRSKRKSVSTLWVWLFPVLSDKLGRFIASSEEGSDECEPP